MKNTLKLSTLAALLLLTAACGQADPASPTTDAGASTSQSTADVVENVTYPWMVEESAQLSYEEFFSEERSYQAADAGESGTTHALGASWSVEDGEDAPLYALQQDKDGFYIALSSDSQTPLYRVPNSAQLVGCETVLTNTRQIYCTRGGELLCVDILTGTTTVLYHGDTLLDVLLAGNEVLYVLTADADTLSLLRIYCPTATTDLLYSCPKTDVPSNWYQLLLPESNQSAVLWDTLNPAFWDEVQKLCSDPETLSVELAYPAAFDVDYIAQCAYQDEAVIYNFSQLQNALNLRPRLRACYDSTTDTYTEQYGIYDICFFGTGIHTDAEHFADTQDYELQR